MAAPAANLSPSKGAAIPSSPGKRALIAFLVLAALLFPLLQVAIGGLIFLVVLIIVHLITARISDSVLDSRVGAIDRILGLAFGMVRGFVLIVIPYMFAVSFVCKDNPARASAQGCRPGELPGERTGHCGEAVARLQRQQQDAAGAAGLVDRLAEPLALLPAHRETAEGDGDRGVVAEASRVGGQGVAGPVDRDAEPGPGAGRQQPPARLAARGNPLAAVGALDHARRAE